MMQKSKTRALAKEQTALRILAISRYLNYEKPLSCRNILKHLKSQYGIMCERKTIYSDIAAINRIVPVEVVYGAKGGFMYVDVVRRCSDE